MVRETRGWHLLELFQIFANKLPSTATDYLTLNRFEVLQIVRGFEKEQKQLLQTFKLYCIARTQAAHIYIRGQKDRSEFKN